VADTTVIYYTSNREKQSFENKICRALLEAKGDLPLISVSQKPMEFGHNICVGDVGAKKQHVYRQLLIGAEAATTRFVCTAESDFLYAPEYFGFSPPDTETFYLAFPCWVLRIQRGKRRVAFRKPTGMDAPLVVGRETLIGRIRDLFADLKDYWSDEWENTRHNPYLLNRKYVKVSPFEAGIGSVTFKTDENMHRGTPWIEATRTEDIPGWGNVFDLQEKYYL
jgi:hypothetical protein